MAAKETAAQPSVRALLDRADLHLRLIGREGDLPEGGLDRALRWVHSTDLADPSPFLADDLLLLTTGRQFSEGSPVDATDYVKRITARGVVALGFGTKVISDGVPDDLADACALAGLPLFEVPYHTPFIAIARANAEAVAAQSFARRSWALTAQRAISLAALRPDGLAATVTELGKQLGTWVGMYDASGTLSHEFPARTLPADSREALDHEVAGLLRRGAQAASTISLHHQPFTLQTLGRGGHLRGAIAIASGDLDYEGRAVLTSVIAMAGLAREQHQSLSQARSALRSGMIAALRASQAQMAIPIAQASGDSLPDEPIVVAIARASTLADAVDEWFDEMPAQSRRRIYVGVAGDNLIAVAPATTPFTEFDEFAERFDLHIGLSQPATYDQFSDALTQAQFARDQGVARVTKFDDAHALGVFGTLTNDSRLVAEAVLAPLRNADSSRSTDLFLTVHAFLEANGSAEATALALGIHRHTVRTRIRSAEQVLGIKLDTFAVRAELWAAFVATDHAR